MSHRPRFSEWQHPDVKAFLRADASRERAVASQARALLAFSALVPLLARLARATVGVGATLASAIDALSGAAALFAVYRLALLSLAGARRGEGADVSAAASAGRPAAASETDLSPAQRRLIGGARARRSPRDAEVDPAFARGAGGRLEHDAKRRTRDVSDADGKPRRRVFGATSRENLAQKSRGAASDGPLFVGIGSPLRGDGAMGSTRSDMMHPDDDGLAYGTVNGTRSGTRVPERSRNAPAERGGSDEKKKNRRFGAFGFGRADASSPDGSFRRVDAADDDAFEAHVRSLEDAVDASFDAAEGHAAGGAFGGLGSPDGRGAPGAPWSRRGATPGSERDPRVSPAYGGGGTTPGSAGSFGGSPGGRYQFRPSPPPRARASPANGAGGVARAAGAAASRGDLSPSAMDVFASLHPEGAAMADVWADRMREWFAFRVLQPLARVLETSHEEVAATLEALGETEFPRPRPLLSADDAHGDRERAGYGARGSETAGALEQDAMVLEQMRVRLEAALAHARAQMAQMAPAPGGGAFGGGGGVFGGGGLFGGGGFGASPQQQQQQQRQRAEKEKEVFLLAAASNAIVTHTRLIALLRAELPRGLLPVTPPGYVARRVAELAEGSCVAEFAHDAGGDWGSERWSGDLPNDAQLMCYLFCAFLETPGWVFAREGVATPEGSRGGASGGGGGGGALYFATPPPPHVERFAAVLSTYRPSGMIKENGCAVVMPRSANPAFAVYCGAVGDDAPRVFDGPNGVWRALCALALHARERGGGALGTTRVASANVALDSVFMPGRLL